MEKYGAIVFADLLSLGYILDCLNANLVFNVKPKVQQAVYNFYTIYKLETTIKRRIPHLTMDGSQEWLNMAKVG